MKVTPFLLSGALAVAIGLPIAGFAQQVPAQSPPSAPQQGAFGHHHRGGMMHRFKDLNLSDQQKQQIKSLMQQFRQAHPRGSQPDPAARKQLHSQILSVLTPQQQAQLKADRAKWKQERMNRRGAAPQASASPAP
ncbi:MAG TPA: hypothetical protein VFN49_13115 [Candidatus Aquilonibacter sp.]|nr:hypothetical protein [Candidatus Aquilonibacter sp.]